MSEDLDKEVYILLLLVVSGLDYMILNHSFSSHQGSQSITRSPIFTKSHLYLRLRNDERMICQSVQ